MTEMYEWQPIADAGGWLAPANQVIETKIDDDNGVRNETMLKRRGSLWWFPDDSMYVYYVPTHWRPLSNGERTPQ
jgi:hypothetical protein